MTDIVEELREAAELDPWYYTVNEAADEIERLRATLDQTRRFALSGEMDTLVSDEIERLREALHKVLGIVGNFPVDRFEYNIIKEARAALGEKE